MNKNSIALFSDYISKFKSFLLAKPDKTKPEPDYNTYLTDAFNKSGQLSFVAVQSISQDPQLNNSFVKDCVLNSSTELSELSTQYKIKAFATFIVMNPQFTSAKGLTTLMSTLEGAHLPTITLDKNSDALVKKREYAQENMAYLKSLCITYIRIMQLHRANGKLNKEDSNTVKYAANALNLSPLDFDSNHLVRSDINNPNSDIKSFQEEGSIKLIGDILNKDFHTLTLEQARKLKRSLSHWAYPPHVKAINSTLGALPNVIKTAAILALGTFAASVLPIAQVPIRTFLAALAPFLGLTTVVATALYPITAAVLLICKIRHNIDFVEGILKKVLDAAHALYKMTSNFVKPIYVFSAIGFVATCFVASHFIPRLDPIAFVKTSVTNVIGPNSIMALGTFVVLIAVISLFATGYTIGFMKEQANLDKAKAWVASPLAETPKIASDVADSVKQEVAAVQNKSRSFYDYVSNNSAEKIADDAVVKIKSGVTQVADTFSSLIGGPKQRGNAVVPGVNNKQPAAI